MLELAGIPDDEADRLVLFYLDAGGREAHGIGHVDRDGAARASWIAGPACGAGFMAAGVLVRGEGAAGDHEDRDSSDRAANVHAFPSSVLSGFVSADGRTRPLA